MDFGFSYFRIGILGFVTAFVVTMLLMPLLIAFINKFKIYDVPDLRKEHFAPIPTMGGIAIFAGMISGCILWFAFFARQLPDLLFLFDCSAVRDWYTG